ncbi:MAG: hypothetical protein RLZZ230_175 [Candidatus Parcubacteria bacterium]|jgi:DNA-binding response OmpR family regulator
MSQTILLCEDEEFVARSYIRKFELEGFVVKHVLNGQDVVSIMESEPIDLVMLDLMMPIKTGFEVLTEIQNSSNENIKKIPVIVASNLGQNSDIEETKRLGAVDFIIKSNLSLKEVMGIIRKHLKQ